jgi:hypothetical protein
VHLKGLAVATAAAVIGVGCATPAFETRDIDEVESALTDAGLQVCETVETDSEIPGSVDGVYLRVAFGPCDGDSDTGAVEVEVFESKATRDAAVLSTHFNSRAQPVRPPTEVGNLTVRLVADSGADVITAYDKAIDDLTDPG